MGTVQKILRKLKVGYTIRYPSADSKKTYIQKHDNGYVISVEEENCTVRKLIDESSLILLLELACSV